MRSMKTALASVIIAVMAIAGGSALAAGHGGRGGGFHGGGFHGGGARVGVFIGAPLFWPSYYYGYPYYYSPYYYPPVVAAPAAPPVYIEQGYARPAPAQAQSSWYYCASSRAYYPYVKQCPEAWQRVAPQPQS